MMFGLPSTAGVAGDAGNGEATGVASGGATGVVGAAVAAASAMVAAPPATCRTCESYAKPKWLPK